MPTFDEIISVPLTEAEKRQFLAEQAFMREVEWAAKHLQKPDNDLWGDGK